MRRTIQFHTTRSPVLTEGEVCQASEDGKTLTTTKSEEKGERESINNMISASPFSQSSIRPFIHPSICIAPQSIILTHQLIILPTQRERARARAHTQIMIIIITTKT